MTDSRNIFSELVEGFETLAADREGNKTLHHQKVEINETPVVTPDEIV